MKIIKKVQRPHACRDELKDVPEGLWIGSIIECSCGQQYIRWDVLPEGHGWAKFPPPGTMSGTVGTYA